VSISRSARDLTQAEADHAGWLGRLLSLENCMQVFEALMMGKGVIKAFCVVADA
jgi:hypothetical protein